MKKSLYLLFLIVLDSLCSFNISAEDLRIHGQDIIKSANSYHIWLNLGVGIQDNKRMEAGLSAGVNLSIQKGIHIISIKYLYADDANKIIVLRPYDKLSSLNLMYGLSHKKPQWYYSLSTGINYSFLHDFVSTGTSPFDGYFVERKKFGIPIDVQLFLTGKWIGVGLNGFVVFNDEFVSCGALLCLQFGKLK